MTLSKKEREEIERMDSVLDNTTSWVAILVAGFVIFIFALLFIFSDISLRIDSLDSFRSFELAKYNFNESECVERSDTVIWKCFEDQPCVNTCTLYCHQTQVEVGKECRNETKIIIESFRDDKDCNTTKCEKGICTSTLLKCIIVKQVNETVCTPTYRTERGFCATAEEVAKAKELGK